MYFSQPFWYNNTKITTERGRNVVPEQLEQLKMLYSSSAVPVAIADENFRVLWCSEEKLSGSFSDGTLFSVFEPGFEIPKSSAVCTGTVGGIPYRYNVLKCGDLFVVEFLSRDAIRDFMAFPAVQDYILNSSAQVRESVSSICIQAKSIFDVLEATENYDCMKSLNIQMGNCYKILKKSMFSGEALKYFYPEINEKVIDLTAFLEESLRKHREILGRNKDEIEIISEPGLKISCDRERLNMALLNAELFVISRRGRKFRVNAQRMGSEILIGISNEASAEEPHREELFSTVYEYRQGGMAESEGLSLYILKLFCQRFGGRIYLRYSRNGGVTLGIRLPASDEIPELELSSDQKIYRDDKFSPAHIALADVYEYPFF